MELIRQQSCHQHNSPTHKHLTKLLSICFATNGLPYRLVESLEFKELLLALDKRYLPPNRRALAEEIAALTMNVESEVRQRIDGAFRLNVVCDIWSRKSLTESYLGILVQFYDGKSETIQRAFLALKLLKGSHTSENIFSSLNEVLVKWGIPEEKVAFFVTDGGSNMVKAFRYETARTTLCFPIT